MGILILSFLASVILGCIAWLLVGDQFPLRHETKFPVHNNIVIYTMLLIVPVYLIVFITF